MPSLRIVAFLFCRRLLHILVNHHVAPMILKKPILIIRLLLNELPPPLHSPQCDLLRHRKPFLMLRLSAVFAFALFAWKDAAKILKLGVNLFFNFPVEVDWYALEIINPRKIEQVAIFSEALHSFGDMSRHANLQ